MDRPRRTHRHPAAARPLEHDVIPVVPPLGCDGEGFTYRLNSDAVAMELAKAVGAAKLIFLTTIPGIIVRTAGEESLERHLSVEEAEQLVQRKGVEIVEPGSSKLASAIKALRGGVPRVHIIDGQVEEGLLGEVFSNEGIGTLVHLNEYQAIRKAMKKDVRAVFALIRGAVENDELLPRTMAEIERTLADYTSSTSTAASPAASPCILIPNRTRRRWRACASRRSSKTRALASAS